MRRYVKIRANSFMKYTVFRDGQIRMYKSYWGTIICEKHGFPKGPDTDVYYKSYWGTLVDFCIVIPRIPWLESKIFLSVRKSALELEHVDVQGVFNLDFTDVNKGEFFFFALACSSSSLQFLS